MMGVMASEETRTTMTSPPTDRPTESTTARRPAPRAWATRLVVVGIVLTALNLRPAITSLGALLEEVRDGLGMSGSVAGLLTSVPPLCFAVFGVTAPRLARRFGPAAVVCAGMAAIAAGLALRPFIGGTAGFLAASALALMGIAVSNVLMPVIVKRWFPDRVGSMTGLYSMALALGTSLAAAVTVPMTDALGGSWRSDSWSGRASPRRPCSRGSRSSARGAPLPAPPSRRPRAPARKPPRCASPAAVRPGPLPSSSASRPPPPTSPWAGWHRSSATPASPRHRGLLLAVTMVMGVPLAFVIPRLATRLPHQGPIVVALGVCGLAGYAGLYLAPAGGAWAWAVLLGISNCAFPLALTMVGMRARTGAGVVQLSAFSQSTGYLLSIPGPLLVGVLYQHSGGWGLPLALMAGLMIPQIAVGILAGRNRTVEDELAG